MGLRDPPGLLPHHSPTARASWGLRPPAFLWALRIRIPLPLPQPPAVAAAAATMAATAVALLGLCPSPHLLIWQEVWTPFPGHLAQQ